jgi:dienelactone hydrolase
VRYWEAAHRDAFATLLRENRRPGSPVAFRIDETRISLVGYSNGGAGVLGVARELGTAVNNVIAMAPYFSPLATPEVSGLTASTLILQGSLDTTTLPQVSRKLHERLPDNADRLYAQFRWVTHFDWIALGRFHNKFKMVITAWLERTQRQSARYEDYLSGEQHRQHQEQGWYDHFLD